MPRVIRQTTWRWSWQSPIDVFVHLLLFSLYPVFLFLNPQIALLRFPRQRSRKCSTTPRLGAAGRARAAFLLALGRSLNGRRPQMTKGIRRKAQGPIPRRCRSRHPLPARGLPEKTPSRGLGARGLGLARPLDSNRNSRQFGAPPARQLRRGDTPREKGATSIMILPKCLNTQIPELNS
jgi:hypothetical protein